MEDWIDEETVKQQNKFLSKFRNGFLIGLGFGFGISAFCMWSANELERENNTNKEIKEAVVVLRNTVDVKQIAKREWIVFLKEQGTYRGEAYGSRLQPDTWFSYPDGHVLTDSHIEIELNAAMIRWQWAGN